MSRHSQWSVMSDLKARTRLGERTSLPTGSQDNSAKPKADPKCITRDGDHCSTRSNWVTFMAGEDKSSNKHLDESQHDDEISVLDSSQITKVYKNVSVNDSTAVLGDVIHYHHYHYHTSDASLDQPLTTEHGWRASRRLGPTSRFELLASYRPKKYAMQEEDVNFCTYFGREIARNHDARLEQISILSSTSTEERIRLTVFLLISSKSKLWYLTKWGSPNHTYITKAPSQLLDRVQTCIRSVDGFTQDARYAILVSDGSDFSSFANAFKSLSELDNEQFDLSQNLRDLTSAISHWQCPWFVEEYLDHRLLFRNRQSNHFLVFANSRWMLETRFSPQKQLFGYQVYHLNVLHLLNGDRGLPQFQGVVRDRRGLVVGFLNDLPVKGWHARFLNNNETSRAFREKWCKQIIETMATFHRQGLIVGMLGGQTDPPIAVDGNDRAILLLQFQEDLSYDATCLGSLPPECRPFCKGMRGSFQTDLYQLGLVLWRIAGDRMRGQRSEFCNAAGCTTSNDTLCQEPHVDPIALPMPTEEYSEYMRHIISVCRCEDPDKRIPACDLVAMFPGNLGHDVYPVHSNINGTTHLARPEMYQQLYSNETTCELCGSDCSSHHFRCSSCGIGRGRFDLCPNCFRKGHHCLDTSHLLRECSWNIDDDKFFTGVKASGRREVDMLNDISAKLI